MPQRIPAPASSARKPSAAKAGENAPSDEKPGGAAPFWRRKSLDDMDKVEWESLCDGCGRCCLVKLEDEDTGRIHFTDVACRLFDAAACRCADYARRRRKVGDCIKLTPAMVRSLTWLPPSCAYRLIAEGRDLLPWHPLVSGSAQTVHEAGVSVRGRVAASETDVALDEYPNHIVAWPGKWPRPKKARVRPLARKARIAGG
jgi:uncharacterized cysteine cluster protein YcgN (CxxCxxCC family)